MASVGEMQTEIGETCRSSVFNGRLTLLWALNPTSSHLSTSQVANEGTVHLGLGWLGQDLCLSFGRRGLQNHACESQGGICWGNLLPASGLWASSLRIKIGV